MDVALQLHNKHSLPENRLLSLNHSTIPPWTDLHPARIRCSLLDPTIDKSSNLTILKSCALETIDSYHDIPIQVYTDGSALEGTTSAGCGAYLKIPGRAEIDISEACGKTCSNYDAEIQGLIYAVENIHQHFVSDQGEPNDVIIFTDSLSTLQALQNLETENDLGIEHLAVTIDKLLTSYAIQLTLQWIPGHCDLQGNERADRLAKEGARKEQPDNPSSYKTVRRILKSNTRNEWLRRWRDGETGRVVFEELKEPNPKDNINSLSRKEQSAIFQLRTGHSKLNYHLNRFDPIHPPHCRNCPHPYETTEHILFECLGLKADREKLLPQFPTIGNSLYGSTSQLRNTAKLYYMSLSSKS